MMVMPLSEAASVLDAGIPQTDVSFRGVSTDTRTLQPGALFFALQGPNFDGHDYLEAASAQGAAAAAVSRDCETALPLVKVADTRLALGRLAGYWRSRFDMPVIAITGSNGKTTVRAMTESILSRCGPTLSTQGNLNNDIGMPLTLARLDASHRFAVLEMGANHAGEINYLAGIARPTIALVNNAAPAHLEGFGSLEGVARAKGELFEALGKDSIAVINADDVFAPLWRQMAGHCRVVEFGLQNQAAVTAEWQGDAAGSKLRLRTPEGEIDIRLPLPGKHNVMNALAASSVAMAAGADLATIRDGLESLQPVAGRFDIRQLPGDITVIDDTYNANPDSLQVALEMLAQAPGKTWLVLGDMGELGTEAATLHRHAGTAARELGVSRLFTLGPLAQEAVAAFGAGGEAFTELDALLDALRGELAGPLHILVKGSRSMRMERIVAALEQDATAADSSHGRHH